MIMVQVTFFFFSFFFLISMAQVIPMHDFVKELCILLYIVFCERELRTLLFDSD